MNETGIECYCGCQDFIASKKDDFIYCEKCPRFFTIKDDKVKLVGSRNKLFWTFMNGPVPACWNTK